MPTHTAPTFISEVLHLAVCFKMNVKVKITVYTAIAYYYVSGWFLRSASILRPCLPPIMTTAATIITAIAQACLANHMESI